jgi:hypothetical protein
VLESGWERRRVGSVLWCLRNAAVKRMPRILVVWQAVLHYKSN